MLCGRAAQISVQVQQPFAFQFSVDEALTKEGIRPTDGKVPKDVNKTLTLSFEDSLDLRDRQELKNYKDRVQSVHINRVWFKVDTNTANVVVPPADVFVQGLSGGQVPKNAVASFPALSPGQNNQQGDLLWTTTGLDTTRKVLEGFGMKIRLASKIQVKGGTDFPKGTIELKVILDVTYTLSLL
jgi:hypothetical protein